MWRISVSFSKKIRGWLFRISVETRFIATENRRDESRLYQLMIPDYLSYFDLFASGFLSFFSKKQNESIYSAPTFRRYERRYVDKRFIYSIDFQLFSALFQFLYQG
jgi:hypothetical protein